jgi:hypothetical protein
LRTPDKVKKLRAVFQAERDRVAMLQPQAAEQMRALVGTFIKLLVRYRLTRSRHDDSRFIGESLCVNGGVAHIIRLAS